MLFPVNREWTIPNAKRPFPKGHSQTMSQQVPFIPSPPPLSPQNTHPEREVAVVPFGLIAETGAPLWHGGGVLRGLGTASQGRSCEDPDLTWSRPFVLRETKPRRPRKLKETTVL